MLIGENMRLLRNENGYSLQQVAEKTGIDDGNLSRYERNLNVPSIELCIKLAEFYKVTLDELIGRDSVKQNVGDNAHAVLHPSLSPTLSDEEQRLLSLFSKMSHGQKIQFFAYGEGLMGLPASSARA